MWVKPREYKVVGAALAAARDRAGLNTGAIGEAASQAAILRFEL